MCVVNLMPMLSLVLIVVSLYHGHGGNTLASRKYTLKYWTEQVSMLFKLLAHGLGRKDKIRYVQSFIYIHIYSYTQRYTYTYTFIQSHTKHNLIHPQSHTYTHIHSHTYSQTHKDSHRDTDYTIVHEMGGGIRRVVEGRGRKSEY